MEILRSGLIYSRGTLAMAKSSKKTSKGSAKKGRKEDLEIIKSAAFSDVVKCAYQTEYETFDELRAEAKTYSFGVKYFRDNQTGEDLARFRVVTFTIVRQSNGVQYLTTEIKRTTLGWKPRYSAVPLYLKLRSASGGLLYTWHPIRLGLGSAPNELYVRCSDVSFTRTSQLSLNVDIFDAVDHASYDYPASEWVRCT